MILNIPSFLVELGHTNYMAALGVIIPSWAGLMILLERFFPYTEGIKLFRRGFWMDLVWYTILQSKVLEVVIFTYIILGLKNYLGLGDSGPLSNWNFWLLLGIFFITHDFYIYWFHRFQHNNKFFWRTHEAHHSVRTIDWLAGSRSHFTEILINQTIEFAPIFFLLNSEVAAFVYPAKALLDALWGMWIHANVNVKSGKLQYVINGPEMHQWHHANHEEVFYKNFSTKIAAWDWIFGTAFLPNLKPISFYFEKPVMYGLPYRYPRDYFSQLIYAFKRFNISKLENNKVYQFINEFRMHFMEIFLGVFKVKKQWVDTELFDTNNEEYYDDDIQSHLCPTCDLPMKYFYFEDKKVEICGDCNTQVDYLDKFN